MTSAEIIGRLKMAASSNSLDEQSHQLTQELVTTGLSTVEPILRFMESNPGLDLGSPGPLVHFVERFYGNGYEQKLIDSLQRKPTPHTVRMLNRVINGTNDPAEKQ